MALTDSAIRVLKPRDKAYKVADEKGLYLQVTPTGGRLWRVKFRAQGGVEKKLSLGAYPDISLKSARELRDAARSMIARGVDPAEQKRRDRRAAKLAAANTFSAIAKDYIAKNARDGLADATVRKREWFLSLVEKSLGGRPIAEIQPFEVLDAVRPYEAAKNDEKAHRTLQFVGQVFRYAIANQLAPSDPTRDLRGALASRKPKHHAAILEPRRVGGRAPRHGEDRDIFERLYAVRLDRLRAQDDCRAVLEPLDHQGLLEGAEPGLDDAAEDISDDDLLAQLGVDAVATDDITELRHVRSAADKRAAEEIANRERCEDFGRFRPLFDAVQNDIDSGARITQPIRKEAGFLKTDIRAGEFFILGGQVAYVAEVGEPIRAPNGESDARLRVIYSNGTESNLLLRSLQRALYKDEVSRRISELSAGPLFADTPDGDDLASGTIYVLRSQSDDPTVAAHRGLLHKIGVTGGDVKQRIAAARFDPTFLLAEVEVVATYQLFNINRARLENLIHRVFDPARLKIEIKDRFGHPVVPREWFLVPLFVIDEAVERIKDGSITGYRYDPATAALVEAP